MNYWMAVSAGLMAAAAIQAAGWQHNYRMAGIFLAFAIANALLAGAK